MAAMTGQLGRRDERTDLREQTPKNVRHPLTL